jgi:hypothetical protein
MREGSSRFRAVYGMNLETNPYCQPGPIRMFYDVPKKIYGRNSVSSDGILRKRSQSGIVNGCDCDRGEHDEAAGISA